jgi:DNA-binding transcriptional ArsR family regulator
MSEVDQDNMIRSNELEFGSEGGLERAAIATRTAASLTNSLTWQALRAPLRMQMLEAIIACPGVDARALAEAIGCSAPRLYYHIKILVEAGLVVSVEGSSRKSARGPSATSYHSNMNEISAGFFAGDPVTIKRAGELFYAIAEQGLAKAIDSVNEPGCIVDFRHEALLPQEVELVKRHMAEIRVVLATARRRRHGSKVLVRSTVFVGLCAISAGSPTLPDAPISTTRLQVEGENKPV